MRRLLQLFSIPLFAGVAAIIIVSSVQAQSTAPLTDAQKERIVANCVPMKANLNQLHASDALLRVNRGQIYESMASNLMERFNTRLSSNGLDNRAMSTVTGNYRSALSEFRSNYIKYEQKVTQALRIDCEAQPESFYAALQESRELRNDVHDNVKRLHQLIDDYRSSVSGFLVNFERLSE